MKIKIFFLLIFYINLAHSSVVMVGTRVIIKSDASEKTVRFNNPDPQPYIVEMSLEDNKGNAISDAPFAIVPPVFRIEPHQGQSVRLITSKATQLLARDRESVFYLNFNQIPAIKASERSGNRLIIAVKSRVKVYYRPDAISGQQSEAYKLLRFLLVDEKVRVENPTGFYISISKAGFIKHHQSISLADGVMLSPFSTMEWVPAGKITAMSGGKILLTQLNDYGAYVEAARDL